MVNNTHFQNLLEIEFTFSTTGSVAPKLMVVENPSSLRLSADLNQSDKPITVKRIVKIYDPTKKAFTITFTNTSKDGVLLIHDYKITVK